MPIRYIGDNRYYFDGWRKSKDYQPYEDQWQQKQNERDRRREVHWPKDRQSEPSNNRMWSSSGQRGWNNWQHQGPRGWSSHDAEGWQHRRHSDWAVERHRQRHSDRPREWRDENRYNRQPERDNHMQRQRLGMVHASDGGMGDRVRDNRRHSIDNPGKHQEHHSDRDEEREEDNESPTEPVYEDQRLGRDRHRYYFDPVYVYIEHAPGGTSKKMVENIERQIIENFDDNVFLTIVKGQFDSFEVYINGKLLYSRLKIGGHPYDNDVIQAIDNVRQGRNFSELQHGQSRVCTIL